MDQLYVFYFYVFIEICCVYVVIFRNRYCKYLLVLVVFQYDFYFMFLFFSMCEVGCIIYEFYFKMESGYKIVFLNKEGFFYLRNYRLIV